MSTTDAANVPEEPKPYRSEVIHGGYPTGAHMVLTQADKYSEPVATLVFFDGDKSLEAVESIYLAVGRGLRILERWKVEALERKLEDERRK